VSQSQIPPGWYPDPNGSGRQVWWDGYAWQPGYLPPPTQQGVAAVGYGYQSSTRTNGLAVASLVLGIVSLCGIGSILAIIFGFVSMNQINGDPSQRGKGMAIAGVVLGFLGLAGIVVLIIVGALSDSSSTAGVGLL